MIHFILLVLALCISGATVAQTPNYRPLTTSPFKPTLVVTHEVSAANISSVTARVGPLMTATGGMAADRLVTPAFGYDTSIMPPIKIANPSTPEAALAAATQWVDFNARAQINYMARYLKEKQISSGFYTFHQHFTMKTAQGNKRKAISWVASLDANARPLYGNPKIVDPDPIYVHAIYYPKRVISGLPTQWSEMYKSAGSIQYQLLNKKLQPISAIKTIPTNGEYDQDMSNSKQLECLVDNRYHKDCRGPIDMRKLMNDEGASGYFLDYVRQLEPVYQPAPDNSGYLVPLGAISYDRRTLYCDRLVNEGFFGYVMHLQAQRYFGIPHATLTPYQTIQQFNGRAMSPTEPFYKEKPMTIDQASMVDRFVISPHPGDNEFWDRKDQKKMANVLYVSELRADEEGSGELDVVKEPDDMVIKELSHVGSVREYYIGTVGDNYWHTGQFIRELIFNVKNLKHTPELAIVEEGFDDWMAVSLNNRQVYHGDGGDVLRYGRDNGRSFAENRCTHLGGSRGFECQIRGSNYKEVQGLASCHSGEYGTVKIDGVDKRVCYELVPVHYVWCTGGRCGDNCPPPLVQYKSRISFTPHGGVFGQSGRFDGCGYQERTTSWLYKHYVDLRPRLRDGLNSIQFNVIALGGGEGWIKVRTRSCGVADYAPTGAHPPIPPSAGEPGVNSTNWIHSQNLTVNPAPN